MPKRGGGRAGVASCLIENKKWWNRWRKHYPHIEQAPRYQYGVVILRLGKGGTPDVAIRFNLTGEEDI